jgi:hypothetical protein
MERDETEYLTSSKANKESLEKAIKEFETNITPNGLIALGFDENYQPTEGGEAGFVYWDLNIIGINILSNEHGTEVEINDHKTIRSVDKLTRIVEALRELE